MDSNFRTAQRIFVLSENFRTQSSILKSQIESFVFGCKIISTESTIPIRESGN